MLKAQPEDIPEPTQPPKLVEVDEALTGDVKSEGLIPLSSVQPLSPDKANGKPKRGGWAMLKAQPEDPPEPALPPKLVEVKETLTGVVKSEVQVPSSSVQPSSPDKANGKPKLPASSGNICTKTSLKGLLGLKVSSPVDTATPMAKMPSPAGSATLPATFTPDNSSCQATTPTLAATSASAEHSLLSATQSVPATLSLVGISATSSVVASPAAQAVAAASPAAQAVAVASPAAQAVAMASPAAQAVAVAAPLATVAESTELLENLSQSKVIIHCSNLLPIVTVL